MGHYYNMKGYTLNFGNYKIISAKRSVNQGQIFDAIKTLQETNAKGFLTTWKAKIIEFES